jgi:hypothetical protein
MTDDPVYLDAGQAGEIMHQTANWMKTNARRGKIPFTRIGRKMVWTPQQLREIGRAGEQKPHVVLVPRTPARRRQSDAAAAALKAKPPRRRRDAA